MPEPLQTTCVHGGLARCWPCMTDGCYDTPRLHPWADEDDIAHAAATGQEPPTGWCGCAFCGLPAVEALAGAAAPQPPNPEGT